MSKKITTLAISIVGLVLLAYTALRTVSLISLTLPAERQAVAYLALVAFDGGLLAWSWFFRSGASGSWQRGISAVMIVVSLAGVLLAFMADTLLQTAARGLTADLDPQTVQAVVIALGVVIGINIAAVVGVHLTDPETLREMAEELAKDRIEDETVKQIQDGAPALAKELAPELARDWMVDMRNRYRAGLRYTAAGNLAIPEKMTDREKVTVPNGRGGR